MNSGTMHQALIVYDMLDNCPIHIRHAVIEDIRALATEDDWLNDIIDGWKDDINPAHVDVGSLRWWDAEAEIDNLILWYKGKN